MPATHKSSLNKNYLAVFAIILLASAALLLFTSFLFFKKTPEPLLLNSSPTKPPISDLPNWETYTNDELEYSIKYPQNMIYAQSGNDVGQIPNTVFYYQKYTGKYYAPVIGIDVYPNSEKLTLEQWLNRRKSDVDAAGSKIQQVEGKQLNVQRAGVRAQLPLFSYVEDLTAEDLRLHSYVFQKEDKVFLLYYSESTRYRDESLEPIFNRMLETLEFRN